jgi:AraC-like DNA-binding protein
MTLIRQKNMNLESLPIEIHRTTQQLDRWNSQSECQQLALQSIRRSKIDTNNLTRHAHPSSTHQVMTNIFGEHWLSASDANFGNPLVLEHLSTGNFQLIDLQWQDAFQLTQTMPADRYLLYVVFSGCLTHKVAEHHTCWCSSETATMINPGQTVEIASSQEGKALSISIDRDSIDRAVSKLLAGGAAPKGNPLKQPVVFTSSIDLTSELGLSLKKFLQFLWESTHATGTASASLVMQKLEQAFLDCAIEGLPSNYTEELLDRADGALATHVRKARAFIASHLQEDIKLGDIAAATNVCSRLLQKAFSHHCGCSPMRFVTQSRLQRIRQELETATSDTKIVDVMMSYGFTQGGKFAKEYQQLFGEKPSQTLRRCSQSQATSNKAPWQQIDESRSEQVSGGVNVNSGCRVAPSNFLKGWHRWLLPGFRTDLF